MIIDTIVSFFYIYSVGCLDNCGVCTGTNANYAECTSCLPGYEKDAVAMTCVGRKRFRCWNVIIFDDTNLQVA